MMNGEYQNPFESYQNSDKGSNDPHNFEAQSRVSLYNDAYSEFMTKDGKSTDLSGKNKYDWSGRPTSLTTEDGDSSYIPGRTSHDEQGRLTSDAEKEDAYKRSGDGTWHLESAKQENDEVRRILGDVQIVSPRERREQGTMRWNLDR
ncbi:MAG: hypothetical protein KC777_01180 [Cyanobacteria bacterium HKST-UBA02]|nr:hypothetical protein [Cyanobacteria bacterium HKST-UBA02]